MTQYTYGDIPDEFHTKKYIPISRHLWKLHKNLGYEIFLDMVENCPDYIHPELKERLDQTIETAKQTFEGKIKDPSKTVSYFLFPPVISVRADLNQGLMKLLYGESIDTSFVVINDSTQEIFMVLNCHAEDGIPVDWWVVEPNDELLDRRHMRLGYKIRDIPKKLKKVNKISEAVINIFKDIRNERAPQWSNSDYQVGTLWGTAMANILCERSSYESVGILWDGLMAQKHYGLPDYWFMFWPLPQMINMFLMMGRREWMLKFDGLITKHQLYVQGLEEIALEWLQNHYPEVWTLVFMEQFEKNGIPMPYLSVDVNPPNPKKDKKVYSQEKFEWEYPSRDDFFTVQDIDVPIDDAYRGILLDVNHETKRKPTHDDVISTGLGTKTKFVK
ncbi:MAG: hypothetical protein EU551_00420 [Promethearchaeota archaeon]|nr:MAG: hypothetical protein EU551_00420 [Candidatus Lokiarchaeota archaeon]